MNRQLASRFAALLDARVAGHNVQEELSNLNPTLQDGYCLFNLYLEWKQALANVPPRMEALEPIRVLAHFIDNLPADDTMALYSRPEWRVLTRLRGPFEGLQSVKCANCGQEYPAFGQSGFDDRAPWVCKKCGDVWLRCYNDDSTLEKCDCGGELHLGGCPKCGCEQGVSRSSGSTYQYFATHKLHENI